MEMEVEWPSRTLIMLIVREKERVLHLRSGFRESHSYEDLSGVLVPYNCLRANSSRGRAPWRNSLWYF